MPRVIAEVDLIKEKYPEVKNKKAANAAAKAAGFKGSAAVKAGKVAGKAVIIVPQQPKKTKYKDKRPIVAETTGKKAYVILKEKEPVKRVKKVPVPVVVHPVEVGSVARPTITVKKSEKKIVIPTLAVKDSKVTMKKYDDIREKLNKVRSEVFQLNKEYEDILKIKSVSEVQRVRDYLSDLQTQMNYTSEYARILTKERGLKDTDEFIIKVDRMGANIYLMMEEVEKVLEGLEEEEGEVEMEKEHAKRLGIKPDYGTDSEEKDSWERD